MGTGSNVLADIVASRKRQQREIAEQQRVQQQNTVGGLLMDAINQSSNIKPTMKDENGNVVPNPAYEQAQQDRRNLLQQYVTLNSPEQHATFANRLHGLIFGHPDERTQQPALSPNSSPNQPPAQQESAPAQPAPPVAPPHPFSSAPHPVLAKFDEAVKGLGNHLSAFAHPLPAQAQPDAAMVAKYYRDPAEVQAERNMEMWGLRGQNAIEAARVRGANVRPIHIGDVTPKDAINNMHNFGYEYLSADGTPYTEAQLSEMPDYMRIAEFRQGNHTFAAPVDQRAQKWNIGGIEYQAGTLGKQGPETLTPIGQATSTLPHSTSSTDAFGTTTTSTRTVPTPGATMPVPAVTAPSGAPTPIPTLKTRPTLADVNANIAAANAASPKLNKGKPVSVAAPAVPSALPPLDQDGHIPEGVGNALARQYANNLLDGQDSKDIPNPRARAAAEALASQYGWNRGAFTPKEKIQFQVATDFLHQLKDSPSLSVLDSYVSREKIARAMKAPDHMNLLDRIAAYNLTDKEADFLKLFNAARGTVAGLSQITRSGRATNSQVQTIANELPNVFQSSSSKDAKSRVDQLLKEADIALHVNPSQVGKGPKSKNAPSLGAWKPPADAPPAPKENNKLLKDERGNVVAVSSGGQWVQP